MTGIENAIGANDGPHALSPAQIERFVQDGFLRIDEAFPRDLADACRRILWMASGCDENTPTTWTRPVVRVGEVPNPLFREAANTPKLHAAFDALVGPERWLPRGSVGTFPIRFPSEEDPGDCGWHVDMSFGTEGQQNFLEWRINVRSKGRALLMLFLFSDVSETDAPTRLRVGSHFDIAQRLAPHGEEGLTLRELSTTGFSESSHRREVLATGRAGTVYLCHPFLVHSAQPLTSARSPRFLGQPALLPKLELDPWRPDAAPVERAIRLAVEV
jgi:hypothetical protein